MYGSVLSTPTMLACRWYIIRGSGNIVRSVSVPEITKVLLSSEHTHTRTHSLQKSIISVGRAYRGWFELVPPGGENWKPETPASFCEISKVKGYLTPGARQSWLLKWFQSLSGLFTIILHFGENSQNSKIENEKIFSSGICCMKF